MMIMMTVIVIMMMVMMMMMNIIAVYYFFFTVNHIEIHMIMAGLSHCYNNITIMLIIIVSNILFITLFHKY